MGGNSASCLVPVWCLSLKEGDGSVLPACAQEYRWSCGYGLLGGLARGAQGLVVFAVVYGSVTSSPAAPLLLVTLFTILAQVKARASSRVAFGLLQVRFV